MGIRIATSATDEMLSITVEVIMPTAAGDLDRPSDCRETMVRETAVAVMASPQSRAMFWSPQISWRRVGGKEGNQGAE